MDEGDLEPEHALARGDVDELGALPGEIRERGPHIVDFVGDVMHAGAVAREKTPDGRIVGERGDQLDAAVTDLHRRCLHALLLDTFPMLEPCTEQLLVRLHRLVEIRDGDADVVDSACLHPGDATAGGSRRVAGARYEVC
jgi:hypothetical protein